MAVFDVFNQAAFSLVSMTQAIESMPYVPQMLGQMGIFRSNPVNTLQVMVDRRDGQIGLIPVSRRGEPPAVVTQQRPRAYSFMTGRLAAESNVYAHEIQDLRAFGTESQLQGLQDYITVRMGDLRRRMELTHENHRMGAINGIVLDADGSTEVENWYDNFGIAVPTAINFDLDNATPAPGALQQVSRDVKRAIVRSGGGLVNENTPITALCGDDFFDAFTKHEEVREIFLNWEARVGSLMDAPIFTAFRFGGIEWINYRSTDDAGATPLVGVPTTECRIFPRSPDIFEVAWSPGETLSQVNTMGRPIYAEIIPEQRPNPRFTTLETTSYPLFMCRRPEVLRRGTLT